MKPPSLTRLNPATRQRTGLAVAALLCALAAPIAAGAAGVCPPKCASVASVVNAAGVPPGVAQVIEGLVFDGPALKDADAALKPLVAEIKALPAKAVVKLTVGADSSLSGAAAKRQATARAAALRTALKKAGVPARRVSVAVAA
jgi:hypothetical protein